MFGHFTTLCMKGLMLMSKSFALHNFRWALSEVLGTSRWLEWSYIMVISLTVQKFETNANVIGFVQ